MQTIAVSGIYMLETAFILLDLYAKMAVNRLFCSQNWFSGLLDFLISSLYL